MNVFDTLFPRHTQTGKCQPRNRTVSKTRARRGTSAVVERLEHRFAFAVVTPFAPRFTANVQGDITFAANTIMTAVAGLPGNATQVADAQNGTDDSGSAPGVWNDDFWTMQFIDIDADGGTFSSSSALLDIPTGAEVLFAGLYWGGRILGDTQLGLADDVKLRGPGDSGYLDLTATSFSSTPQGAPTAGARNYQGFKDVTSLVQAKGEGSYTVANVQAHEGKNYSAGWSLVVAFRDNTDLPRNLTVFDGFAYVTTGDDDVTIPFSGFRAPQDGPVNATLGIIAYEGDLGITGDAAYFNGGLGEAVLSNDTNPPNNFFNSSISNRGVTVTTKSPNYKNQLGFGADLIEADGLIANNATSATLRLTTSQDFYYPGVITSAIEVYAPKTTVLKVAEDLNGGLVEPGDTLRYTVTVSNSASAYDTASDVVLDDLIPTSTTYKPGTLAIIAGANSGAMTDAADGDYAEFVAGGNGAVRFRLGTGATGATVPTPTGGTLAAGQSTTATFEVLVGDFPSAAVIRNTASVSYEGTFFGPFTRTSETETQCPPVIDLAVTKTDSSTTYVPGAPVTYSFTVQNNGPAGSPASMVTDTLPSQTTFTLADNPGWTLIGSTLTYVTPALASGAFTTFPLKLLPAPDRTSLLVNTAIVAVPPGYFDRNLSNNSSTDTSTAAPAVTLGITKTDNSLTYVPGTNTTYSIVVSNSGPSVLVGGLVTDTIPVDTTWVSGGTYNAATRTVSFTTSSIAVDGSETFSFTVLTDADRTDVLTNTATVTPPQGTTGNSASSTDTSTVAPAVTLSVTKDNGQTRYTPGTSTTYTIIVTNTGPSFLKGGTVKDLMPFPQGGSASWTTSVSGVGSSVFPTSGGNDINATIDVAVNGTVTFLYTLNILPNATGQMDNTVTVSPPPGTTGNTASSTDTEFPVEPPLSIEGGLVIGTDDGCNGRTDTRVRVIDALDGGFELFSFVPYPGWKGSVRVATGDINGDGIQEIITAPGRNRVGEIRVFDSTTGVELTAYRKLPFGPAYRGGVEVAVGNLNTDIYGDIIAGMSTGAGMVRGFLVNAGGVDPAPYKSFRGFPAPYTGGVKLSAADFGSYVGSTWTPGVFDGISEVVVGSNAGIRATVKVVDVSAAPKTVRTILPFAANFRGGVTLATGRYNLDLVPDIFVGAGVGGKSALEVWSVAGGPAAKLAVFAGMAKQNATLFTAPLDTTGTGVVTNIYGVQGLNGGGGTKGVRDYQRGSPGTAAVLPATNNANFSPPLRIAPLRLPPVGLRRSPR